MKRLFIPKYLKRLIRKQDSQAMQNNFPFISILVISCLLIFQSRKKKKKDIFLWLSGFTNSNKSYYQEKYTGSYLQRWIFAVLFPDAYKILLFIRFYDLNILFCRCIIWISIILTVLAIACFFLFNLQFFFSSAVFPECLLEIVHLTLTGGLMQLSTRSWTVKSIL